MEFFNNEKSRTEKILKAIKEKNSDFWMKEREKSSLALFKKAAKNVPAYKDFLQKNKIQAEKIKTWQDFQNVPPMDKKNYLRQYPLEQLCWDGSLKKPLVFTSTSGSTGEPFYFPRLEKIDWQYSILQELFLEQSSIVNNEPILVIVCFGMGVWIGGLISYEAFEMASRRSDYSVSILTPGINKEEIFKALKKLSPKFAQTILVGYPPFIKDLIDEASGRDINLSKINLRLVFAAEVFTENFRDYIVQKARIRSPYLDIIHIYGSADIGAMAWETGGATLIKRLSMGNKNLFNKLFSNINKTPTLAQFNPSFVSFEAPDGEVFLTGDNAIPLIRYAIGDRGGVFSFKDAVSNLKQYGCDIKDEINKAGINGYVNELPFVYIYERSDMSTTLYGLQIFPEIIRDALISGVAADYLTGKFSLSTKFDANQDQYLEINIELRNDKIINDQFKKALTDLIVSTLCIKSSEFNELNNHLKERAAPKLVFWPFEHPEHFKPGIKQKWVKNN